MNPFKAPLALGSVTNFQSWGEFGSHKWNQGILILSVCSPPASKSRTLKCSTSANRPAKTDPAVPPPTTKKGRRIGERARFYFHRLSPIMKSYSVSMSYWSTLPISLVTIDSKITQAPNTCVAVFHKHFCQENIPPWLQFDHWKKGFHSSLTEYLSFSQPTNPPTNSSTTCHQANPVSVGPPTVFCSLNWRWIPITDRHILTDSVNEWSDQPDNQNQTEIERELSTDRTPLANAQSIFCLGFSDRSKCPFIKRSLGHRAWNDHARNNEWKYNVGSGNEIIQGQRKKCNHVNVVLVRQVHDELCDRRKLLYLSFQRCLGWQNPLEVILLCRELKVTPQNCFCLAVS